MGDRNDDQSRRAFVKKAAYVAPAIITLKAVPAVASYGSEWSAGDRAAAKEAEKAVKEADKAARQEAKEAAQDAKRSDK